MSCPPGAVLWLARPIRRGGIALHVPEVLQYRLPPQIPLMPEWCAMKLKRLPRQCWLACMDINEWRQRLPQRCRRLPHQLRQRDFQADLLMGLLKLAALVLMAGGLMLFLRGASSDPAAVNGGAWHRPMAPQPQVHFSPQQQVPPHSQIPHPQAKGGKPRQRQRTPSPQQPLPPPPREEVQVQQQQAALEWARRSAVRNSQPAPKHTRQKMAKSH